jgi:exopolysaccharide biosynthesis polyprenyl glycosylphosphotransferase
MEEFQKKQRLGFQVIAQYAHFNEQTKQNLIQLKTKNSLEEILLADPHLSSEQTLELVALCDSEHLTCKYTADLFATAVGKTDIAMYAGIPIIEIKKTPLDGWGQIAKRIFDLFFSLLFIILFSPLMFLTAMMIKLDSKGPVFYLDYRTGQHNKKFIFYKFRSMIAELCDGEGPSGTQKGNTYLDQLEKEKNNLRTGDPLHKIKDDPRITRFGRFIRKWSIDELPQLFNVLKGNISLVGPRPHMTLETAKYEKRYRNVFTIKPGITGLAQISGRSDLNFEEEVRLDTYYIENWNILLDIGILLRTPLAIIKPRKAE